MALIQVPFLIIILLLATCRSRCTSAANASSSSSSSSSNSDVAALLKFKSSITGGGAGAGAGAADINNDVAFSTWSDDINNKPPCSGDTSNWAHVRCSGGSVWSIQLKDLVGLTAGSIDLDSLAAIQSLRTLSLVNNSFGGPLPAAINKLSSLKSVFLSYNKFSGEMGDDAFKGMLSLKKLHLDHNALSGNIPGSLAQLPKLLELRLEGNNLSGQIPDFNQHQNQLLQVVDVSNNALEGQIPASLANMKSSYFTGNKGLCGPPLPTCSSSSHDEKINNNNNNLSTSKAAIIAAVVAVAVLAAVFLIVLCLRKRDTTDSRAIEEATPTTTPSNLQSKATCCFNELQHHHHPSSTNVQHSGRAELAANMKLTFVKSDETPKFDLQDLLKASAEILGSGCFGSSYKAALTSVTVVVKRFRQMNNVGREEFEEHMRRLGRLSHPNLLPLVAYYYRKEEKLLVSEYVSRGSLALHLHMSVGGGGGGHAPLDWPMRLKIVKGVVRGLVYLYNELPSLIAPHGHLKSSNVLLNESYEPLLHDYGLIPVINQEISQDLMVAYKSPEYLLNTRITKKTDVWSLGILILEIITGKFPSNFLLQGKGKGKGHQTNYAAAAPTDQLLDKDDLAAWVRSVGPTNRVFDREMKAPSNFDNDIIKLLNIALGCCEPDIDKRLDIKETAQKIEEMKEPEDDFFSLCASDTADFRSSRALSDDFTAPR